MKLKVALAKIEKFYQESSGFAVLRNVNTGKDLYVGPSWDGEPLILTKVGFTKQEREDEGFEDSGESELHHLGRGISEQKFLVDEVTDHQWAVAFLEDCPVSRLRDGAIHLKPEYSEIKFSV